MKHTNISDIIDGAIKKEDEAYHTYITALDFTDDPAIKKLFQQLAGDELEHKKKLLNLNTMSINEKIDSIDSESSYIVDFLVDKPLEEISSLQEVFIFAMKRERKAFHFYSETAKMASHQQSKQLLQMLAREEQKHLDKLETIYDEKILSEN